MHMLNKRDLNSAELETVRVSRTPVIVITVNGEVQTNEEAAVYVKEFDLFVTAKLLQDTRAVLSLGKLCKECGSVTTSLERAEGHIARRKTTYQSLTQDWQPVPSVRLQVLLQHYYRRTQ